MAITGNIATSRVTNPLLTKEVQALNNASFFSSLTSSILAIGFIAGGLIFVFMLIMGSLAWISSGGDKGQTEAARSRVTNAVIGLVVLFSIFAVIKLVEAVFGVSILKIDINSLRV